MPRKDKAKQSLLPRLPTKEELSELRELHTMLKRYLYHFKNADRHQVYWRRFTRFCSQVGLVVLDVTLYYSEASLMKSLENKNYRSLAYEDIQKYMGRFYQSFHQLLRSYPNKALFLLASLATLSRIVNITGPAELKDAEAIEVRSSYGAVFGDGRVGSGGVS